MDELIRELEEQVALLEKQMEQSEPKSSGRTFYLGAISVAYADLHRAQSAGRRMADREPAWTSEP